MKENSLWGYEEIYGGSKPEYHEPLDKDMKDALDYLCARVRRSGDFWSALRTAAAMYCVNYNDLRTHFERRKKAGIARKAAGKRNAGKWYAVRYVRETGNGKGNSGWMFLKAAGPEKAELAVIRDRKRPDCTISVEACMPFGTKEEADRYASSWEKEHGICQPALPGLAL